MNINTIDIDLIEYIGDVDGAVKVTLSDGKTLFISTDERDRLMVYLKGIQSYYVLDGEIIKTNASKTIHIKPTVYSREDAQELLDWEKHIKDRDLLEAKELMSREELLEVVEIEDELVAIKVEYDRIRDLQANQIKESSARRFDNKARKIAHQYIMCDNKLAILLVRPKRDWDTMKERKAREIKTRSCYNLNEKRYIWNIQ